MKYPYFIVNLLIIFLFAINSQAQNHFQKAFTGFGFDHMNINVLEAKIAGTNLQQGDEIGIFDGSLCVGAVRLTQSLGSFNDQTLAVAIVSKVDEGKDGYNVGNQIIFKLWDSSSQTEFNVSSPVYYNNYANQTNTRAFEIGASVFVSLSADQNQPPIAHAGNDFEMNENTQRSLDGGNSYDPDNDPISYAWIVPSGFEISGSTSAQPLITAPEIDDLEEDFEIYLSVSDGEYLSYDTVVVTVNKTNQKPVANAGNNFSIREQKIATLDGTSSYDPEGQPLTYLWTSLSGIVLNSPTVAAPTFETPSVMSSTNLVFSLTVNDGIEDSEKDNVTVTVTKNNEPIANAGSDQTVYAGSEVNLSGLGSYDIDGDELSFSWTAPDGIDLSDTEAENPVFTAPDITGTQDYIVSLTVSDDLSTSNPNSVVITVVGNQIPIAVASDDQIVNEGETVYLSGENSYDSDGGEVQTYAWSADSFITLNNPNSVHCSFLAPEVEKDTTIVVQLVVNDGKSNSLPDQVEIKIVNVVSPPVAFSQQYAGKEDRDLYVILRASDEFDDQSSLLFDIKGMPNHGTIKKQIDNVLLISPDDNYYGTDTITFKVQNTNGYWSEEAVASLFFESVNDAPKAEILLRDAEQKASLEIDFAELISDVEKADENLQLFTKDALLGGSLTFVSQKVFRYDIGSNRLGIDILPFRAFDGELASNLGLLLLTNLATTKSARVDQNSQLAALSESIQVEFGKSQMLDLIGIDLQSPYQQLEISIEKQPEHGKIGVLEFSEVSNNMVTSYLLKYTPSVNESINDSIVYRVTDGENSVFGVINLSVLSRNAAPIIEEIPTSYAKINSSITIPINCTDDESLDELIFELVDPLEQGFSSQFRVENGQIVLQLTPPPNFTGVVSLSIKVTDTDALSSSEPFLVVLSANTVPEFTSTPVMQAFNNLEYSYVIEVSDADTEDNISILLVGKPSWLSLSQAGRGSAILSGIPPNNLPKGDYLVQLTADDGHLLEPVQQSFIIHVDWATETKIIEQNKFVVYPNPTSGILTLRFDHNPEKGSYIEIYNSVGTLLQNHNLISGLHQFDISGYAHGIYYLRIKSGDITKTEKIILNNSN